MDLFLIPVSQRNRSFIIETINIHDNMFVGICRPDTSIIGDCYEFLFLVSTVHEDGIRDLYKCGGMQVVATQVSILPDGKYIKTKVLQ